MRMNQQKRQEDEVAGRGVGKGELGRWVPRDKSCGQVKKAWLGEGVRVRL